MSLIDCTSKLVSKSQGKILSWFLMIVIFIDKEEELCSLGKWTKINVQVEILKGFEVYQKFILINILCDMETRDWFVFREVNISVTKWIT